MIAYSNFDRRENMKNIRAPLYYYYTSHCIHILRPDFIDAIVGDLVSGLKSLIYKSKLKFELTYVYSWIRMQCFYSRVNIKLNAPLMSVAISPTVFIVQTQWHWEFRVKDKRSSWAHCIAKPILSLQASTVNVSVSNFWHAQNRFFERKTNSLIYGFLFWDILLQIFMLNILNYSEYIDCVSTILLNIEHLIKISFYSVLNSCNILVL